MTEEQKQRKREYAKAWRQANPTYQKKWREENPGYQERWNRANPLYLTQMYRKQKYGVTPEMFEAMLNNQTSQCAICGSMFGTKQADKPCVDHCHTTGKIRDLLCGHCNKGLGFFKDNPSLLQAAVQYLSKHQ